MSIEHVENESSTIDSLLTKTREILAASEADAIESLKPVVTKEPPKNAIFACFELFDTQDFGMNYNIFSVGKADGKDVLNTDWTTFQGEGVSFIPKLKAYSEEDTGAAELSEKEGREFTVKLEKLLFEWFAKCWKAAGGEHSTLPTYFAFDKEYKCRDLFTGEIMSEEETAKKLGYDVVLDSGPTGTEFVTASGVKGTYTINDLTKDPRYKQ